MASQSLQSNHSLRMSPFVFPRCWRIWLAIAIVSSTVHAMRLGAQESPSPSPRPGEGVVQETRSDESNASTATGETSPAPDASTTPATPADDDAGPAKTPLAEEASPETPSDENADLGAKADAEAGAETSEKPETSPAMPANEDADPEATVEPAGTTDSKLAVEAPEKHDGLLHFSFEGAPWREVIRWLADQSDLALHVGDLPTGSFTYSDPNGFTGQEAIDRVNLFLLPQGFTLVRSGQLLSVINLSDPRAMQQLDALAKLVSVEDLDQLNDHDVVKCFFPLDEFDAEDAVDELSALDLMTDPAVFAKTNRLLITDTVANLKAVRAILDAFEPATMDDGTVMQTFPLQYVSAEDILVVARPHLGLATGEMIGIDVSLSADLQGKNIFVTGVEDKVKLIEGLITALDKPEESLSVTGGTEELRSHFVQGGNVEIIYNVLQTLLAGKSVRLSMDEDAGSIVALATPDIQAEIAETVTQLQASEAEFAVIQLKWIDPYFAVSLLEQMLDLDGLEERSSERSERYSRYGNSGDRGRDAESDIPKIDADPGGMRLFVRAKKPQLEQIKKMVAEFDVSSNASETQEGFRLFPLTGRQAEQVLGLAASFWRKPNLILLYEPTLAATSKPAERVVADKDQEAKSADILPTNSDVQNARILAGDINSQLPAIRCQLTPRGMLLQSDDTEALDQFYEQLQTIVGPTEGLPSPPVVFYLRYTKPDDALRMLAELLDGGESAKEAETGTLVNGYVSSGSSNTYYGSIVTSSSGTTTLIAGTITVVADSRLNRLIAQGTTSDIELIESYLEIVDKDSSLTSIETHGTSHVIELEHTPASEVAAAIREAYVGRVAGVPGGAGRSQPGSQQPGQRNAPASKSQSDEQRDGEKKAPDRKPGGASVQPVEPQLTIAVHEPSNSLIVTAPEQLFKEVEALAKMIDSRNEQAVDVLEISNPAQVEFLQQFLSGKVGPGSGVPKTTPSRTPSTPNKNGQ